MADEEGSGVSDQQYLAEISARDKEVTALLAKKSKAQALNVSLQSPPLGTKSVEVKDASAAVVEKVVSQISESEVVTIIETLDLDTCDTLMKYLYRFMGKASNCAIVLKLHASLTEKAGIGSIIRTLSERKTVL